MAGIDRRDFLKAAGAVGGAAALGGGAWALLGDGDDDAVTSVLAHPARECPVDTVVVLMLENRSFDHYYGWLAKDEAYLEAGRSRWGRRFRVDGRQDVEFPDPLGVPVATQHLSLPTEANPYRGCGHTIPGHDWNQGRAELDRGFLSPGSGNDRFALGYYDGEDLKVHARFAERFTVFDHYHASLLGGTFPNRQYMHAATSNGVKYDPLNLDLDTFHGPTIWDTLERAGVDAGYYFTDLPILLLWGEQYAGRVHQINKFFEQADAGALPRVVFVDPGFGTSLRTDDHPLGDVHLGQRFVREVFGAFQRSKHWERGAFFLVYDEWGGFFDHVTPPRLADARASKVLDDDFSQSGFRVPAVLASPYAARGGVDHRVYDHTSILRFLEWRFAGAPAEGPGRRGDSWFLTDRDRHANNIGRTLSPELKDPDLGFDADIPVAPFSPGCGPISDAQGQALIDDSDLLFTPNPQFGEYIARTYPEPTITPWIEGMVTELPAAPTTTAP